MLNRIGRTCISLFTVEHFSFHAFCVSQRDLMSCSSHLTLQRRQIVFLHISVFLKKLQNLFNAAGHHACNPTPTKISTDILLPAENTFDLKLA